MTDYPTDNPRVRAAGPSPQNRRTQLNQSLFHTVDATESGEAPSLATAPREERATPPTRARFQDPAAASIDVDGEPLTATRTRADEGLQRLETALPQTAPLLPIFPATRRL